jgi:DNA-binding HxlR family transcriptional regulator
MQWRHIGGMPCSIARTLSVIGERWTLLILREAFSGVRRFEGFERHLGIARNVLATRLRGLVRDGILERERYAEAPDRHEYVLTKKGRALYPVLLTLLAWGDEWMAGVAGPPVRLRHRACEKQVTARTVCSECGEPLSPDDIRAIAGPGLLRP